MDRISGLCNHKCPKGKIRPRDCPNDYSCRFTLDSSRGGGDSFEGKVSELTSSGIKRGSCGAWRTQPLIHELFRYERLTRFSCLSDFSVSQRDTAHRWGCNLCSEPTLTLRHCWNFHFARCTWSCSTFFPPSFFLVFIVIYRFVRPTCFIFCPLYFLGL